MTNYILTVIGTVTYSFLFGFMVWYWQDSIGVGPAIGGLLGLILFKMDFKGTPNDII